MPTHQSMNTRQHKQVMSMVQKRTTAGPASPNSNDSHLRTFTAEHLSENPNTNSNTMTRGNSMKGLQVESGIGHLD